MILLGICHRAPAPRPHRLVGDASHVLRPEGRFREPPALLHTLHECIALTPWHWHHEPVIERCARGLYASPVASMDVGQKGRHGCRHQRTLHGTRQRLQDGLTELLSAPAIPGAGRRDARGVAEPRNSSSGAAGNCRLSASDCLPRERWTGSPSRTARRSPRLLTKPATRAVSCAVRRLRCVYRAGRISLRRNTGVGGRVLVGHRAGTIP
jgi:hypothetical protein